MPHAQDQEGTAIENESRAVPSVLSPYLTSAEAAAYLRYKSGSAIRNLVLSGRLVPAGRRGRAYLFLRSDLDAMVELGFAQRSRNAGRHGNPSRVSISDDMTRGHGAPVTRMGAEDEDEISGNRNHVRRPQTHPAASRGPTNRSDEGDRQNHHGNGPRGGAAPRTMAVPDSQFGPGGKGCSEAEALRAIVARVQGSRAEGVYLEDVR